MRRIYGWLAILSPLACIEAASAQLFADVQAETAGGRVSHSGLAVVSSDYQATGGVQATVEAITSGGLQPMADTQGAGQMAYADGYGMVSYDFRVTGPSVDANGNVVRVPVIIEAIVHVDARDRAFAQARFRWSNHSWATRFVQVEGTDSATRSLYVRSSLIPGSGERFTLDVRGIVSTQYGTTPTYQGEFQAIADPYVYIDPTFADRDSYSLVFSPGLFPPEAPLCTVFPEGSATVVPGEALELTVTCTAPGEDEIVLSSPNLPPGVVPDGEWPAAAAGRVSRTFHWSPSAQETGIYVMKFVGTNAAGTTQRTRRVHVTDDPLIIDAFAPAFGPVGTEVEIHGSNFLGVTAVLFGTVPVGEPYFDVVSDSLITAVVPIEASSAPIRVLTDIDDVRSDAAFFVGSQPPPDPPLLADGFESGDTAAWEALAM